jgi:hypothetical protein
MGGNKILTGALIVLIAVLLVGTAAYFGRTQRIVVLRGFSNPSRMLPRYRQFLNPEQIL